MGKKTKWCDLCGKDENRFDATRCELQFSKGVAGNIDAGANEIERLRTALRRISIYDHRWPENAADIARKALAVTNGERG